MGSTISSIRSETGASESSNNFNGDGDDNEGGLGNIVIDSLNDNASVTQYIDAMVQRAKDGTELTDIEIQDLINSLSNLLPENSPVDMDDVANFLRDVAHLSHKDWERTSSNSDRLCRSLSASSDDVSEDSFPLSSHARQLLERILQDGNWQGAVDHAKALSSSTPSLSSSNEQSPWAVLVTGVNGIRKTTSMYQPWFPQLLQEALVCPTVDGKSNVPPLKALPTGTNSFFRQLDHMIATLCNEEFSRLYAWSASQLNQGNDDSSTGGGDTRTATTTRKRNADGSHADPIPSEETVQKYSDYKAAIFSRYRTLSELLGALLLKQAQLVKINCLMETSGRDVAMFKYVDHFFPESSRYNKLALHFTINDLSQAKNSVDRRMIEEIQAGARAVETGDAFSIVYTNQGGPYGSKVLADVQRDSDMVWETEVMSGNVGKDWYKATIAIHAHPTEPWTAQAVKPDGSLGTRFEFLPRK
jgi:hypothetical protein